jgi:hypothetical protein
MLSVQLHAQGPDASEKDAVSMSSNDWKVITKSPGVMIVSEEQKNSGQLLADNQIPVEAAQDWLDEIGLEEGRNLKGEKLLYVSIGSASVNAKPDNPAYIDSRYLAYQRAELEAKVKTALFLGVDLTTARGSSERQINPKERADLERIVNASPTIKKNIDTFGVKDKIYGLFEKASKLADAKLDQAIEKTGADVSDMNKKIEQKKAKEKFKRNKMSDLSNISEASIATAASSFADIQGTQVIQSFEGSYHDNYQVVVITLWSQNLQRMVDSMKNGIAPQGLTRKKAKAEVKKQLSDDPTELSCLTGVRAYINQYGNHVLLSFAQSGVTVIGGRKDKAFEVAGKKARLRAMSAIRTFMGEKIAFNATEELREVLALYSNESSSDGGSSEYKSLNQLQEKIETISKKQNIAGIHGLMTKELVHPFTDKPMVLKVMAWSPSSQAMSQQVKKQITYGVDAPKEKKPEVVKKVETEFKKGTISSGKGADSDAY